MMIAARWVSDEAFTLLETECSSTRRRHSHTWGVVLHTAQPPPQLWMKHCWTYICECALRHNSLTIVASALTSSSQTGFFPLPDILSRKDEMKSWACLSHGLLWNLFPPWNSHQLASQPWPPWLVDIISWNFELVLWIQIDVNYYFEFRLMN